MQTYNTKVRLDGKRINKIQALRKLPRWQGLSKQDAVNRLIDEAYDKEINSNEPRQP